MITTVCTRLRAKRDQLPLRVEPKHTQATDWQTD